MRKLALVAFSLAAGTSGTAIGADYPRAPTAAAPAAVTPAAAFFAPVWAGPFFGAHLGFGRSEKRFIDNFPVYDGELDAAPKLHGAVGGLQLGYNYQLHGLVLGVEGDFSWSGIGKRGFSCFFFGDQICSAETEWTGTLTGRIGAAVGPAMFYVKGGGALARDRYTDLATCAGSQPVFREGIFADCGDAYVGHHTRSGWTIGGGVEYRIAPNWSVKAEYSHMDFGKRSVTLTDEDGDKFTEEIHQRVDVVKVGFNYFFGAPITAPAATPVIAAYAQATGTSGATDSAPIASDDDEKTETVSVFATTEVARRHVGSWLGAMIALSGDLDTSGPRMMILGGGGRYKYYSDGEPIRGTYVFGDVLAGYGFEGDNYSINMMAGVNAVNHSLSQLDPTNTVQGTEAGLKIYGSAYVNPTQATLYFGELDYSTAFETFSTAHKVGYALFGNNVFVGPQASYFRDERSEQWRLGAHISELKLGDLQIDLTAGYLNDSINGEGAYARVEARRNF
jgi:opacity protein-like surface antigen